MIIAAALRKYVLGAVVSVGVLGGGWLYHEWQTGKLEKELGAAQAEAVSLTEKVKSWQAHAQQLATRLELERQERRRSEAAVRNLLHDLAADEKRAEALIVEVERSPDRDDGPVAPVLKRALEGLSP